MTPDEALEFIKQLFLSHQQTHLSNCQEIVIQGILDGKTYRQISDEHPWTEQHLRSTGSDLLKQIASFLNVRTNKNNLKQTIEYAYRQANQSSSVIQIDPSVTQKSDPSGNPFIPLTAMIDDPTLFFNRDRDLRSIFELLNSRSSVAVIGERQIGKSSLLKAIERQAQDRLYSPRQPIYLNLQRIENEDDFYSYFCDEIGIDECRVNQLNNNLKDERLLVLIDEIERMAENGFTYQVRTWLRSQAEGANAPLRLVIAAREPLTSLFDEGKTSPLANICIEERLDVWDEKTARNFIAHRLEPTAIQFSEDEIVQLIAESGGHPQKLMYLCYRLYQRYREEETSET